MVKRYLNDSHSTHNYDANILREITCHHLELLKSEDRFGLRIGLIRPKPAKHALLAWLLELTQGVADGLRTSDTARYSEFGTFGRGDMVALKLDGVWALGHVQFIADVAWASEEFALVRRLHLVERHTTYSVWQRSPETTEIIYFNEIMDTVVWSASAGGELITVLHPYIMQ